jgi:hypothetical protein
MTLVSVVLSLSLKELAEGDNKDIELWIGQTTLLFTFKLVK